MRSFLFVLLTLLLPLFAAEKPASVEYVYPLDESDFVARSAEIIFRPGARIDAASLENAGIFKLTGSLSGEHIGQVRLAPDRKTILFKPDIPFAPDETVSVTIKPKIRTVSGENAPGHSFSFQTTPLQNPLNPWDYIDSLNPLGLPEQLQEKGLSKSQDDELPSDFPDYTVTVTGTPSEGDLFISPTHFISGDGYNLIINNAGETVYYNKITDGVPVDFKVLPNGRLSYGSMYEFHSFVGGGPTTFNILDSTYTIVDTYQMGNGYTADSHEFQLLPNGHALMLSYDVQPVDMSMLVEGGHPGALVAGTVIQELDQDKNVIFQWRSWDYLNLTDSYNDLTLSVFDAVHINSLELDSDNHLLVSTMAFAEITKINRQTGEIIWRMGGKNNEFTFINESQEHAPIYFMFQHDVRRIANGNITLFDGGDATRRAWSRVVEYQLDEVNKTATKVWDYRHSPDIFTPTMGSCQRLPNGNTLIGWGMASMTGKPAVTEVDAAGNVVYELKFKQLLQASYRAMRFTWDGGQPVADVMRQELLVGNTYDFDNPEEKTGVIIKLEANSGFGYNEAYVTRYNYSPFQPQFPGKAPVVLPTRIVVSQFNIFNVRADISFDVDFYGIENPESILVYHREFEGRGLFVPLPTEYNHVTGKIKATMTRFGEFLLTYQDYNSIALQPLPISPMDGASVDQSRAVDLEWTPVGFVSDYQLQVATDETFTNPVVDEEFLTGAVYTLDTVEDNTTYYWRVKSFNDAGESPWTEAQSFDSSVPFVTVTAPDGGESLQLGINHYVTWTSNIEENIIVDLYKNGNFSMEIDTAANTGGYQWEIPLGMDKTADYKIKIRSAERDVSDMSDGNFSIVDNTGVDASSEERPASFMLSQNYPNPFNARTRITYSLPEKVHVTLKIVDVTGSIVSTLVDGVRTAGKHSVTFDAREIPTGMYFFQIRAGSEFAQTRKMILTK